MSLFKQNLYEGKCIFITGGATGICYQIAKSFLLHKAKVCIVSRKIQNIQKALASLAKQTQNNFIIGKSCDVRNIKSVEDTVRFAVQKFSTIDVVVNGAAGNFIAPFEKLSLNAFKTVLQIDTIGTFIVCKVVYNQVFKNKPGVIINISALLHRSGTANQLHSGTAKAGVDAITKHLAVQLGPKNIRVVGIAPGLIQQTQGATRLAPKDTSPLELVIPLSRWGKKIDVANSVLFIASDAASYITGQTIIVDGGRSLTFPNFPFSSEQFRNNYAKKSKL